MTAIDIRRLDLQITSFLELRFNPNKSEEEVEAEERLVERLIGNTDLVDFIRGVTPSTDIDEKLIQKFLIAATMLYVDEEDADIGNLLFILELLEKRLRVPQYLHHDFCMLIVDCRSLITLTLNEEEAMSKDDLRHFLLNPLPLDSPLRPTKKQNRDFEAKLYSLQDKLIDNAPKNWKDIGLMADLQTDSTSILRRLFEWNMEDGEYFKDSEFAGKPKNAQDMKKVVKNYAPAVQDFKSYSSPKPAIVPSVPPFKPAIGRSPSAPSHQSLSAPFQGDFEDDYIQEIPAATAQLSPVQIKKRKFHFDFDVQNENVAAASQRKKLAAVVGKRFLDASLRRQAIDTFQFRPLPQEIAGGFAVEWPQKPPVEKSSSATPRVASALKSLKQYFSPQTWL